MSRIKQKFSDLKVKNRKALIPFITAGDPEPGLTVQMMHALVEGGADLIELGVPFSDPMADGPVIQLSYERALEHHVSLAQVLEMVSEFRSKDSETPVVLMGYLNPVELMGYEQFAERATAAGVDGALIVDLSPEESDSVVTTFRDRGLDSIYLIAPTSSAERIKKITDCSSGFVYYVSLKGVTGAGHLDTDAVANKVAEIRGITDLPVGVGFGIKDADSARRVAGSGDAVVVGSAVIRRVEELSADPAALLAELSRFATELRGALDEAAA
ncbi:tryptophan synthase subunit alpha [Solemya pervernicosa gill symbiont]|uniref:Tryptophan synthase alpha chain n=2 Tax=Gammaproteobacteria incertae sedis TaxID=118884 RepID=A0A1T2L6V8_9GAMM|nr:tryptophan synthase subunit alpha [Candidatus Reidiella endopervernicosa]OOZ40821.1 tryptophan synthase subunit alpha [Solemya pervernicosa gill symbiont]QKQ26332.1 tryptophan synthase subunit alpha [Candidatus Reidiella endopervernicosa]